jgi:hypothetical protein
MDPYRQSIAAVGLAIERGTSAVPDDGHFYVLFAGQMQGRHRTLKKAQAQYREILSNQDWKPKPLSQARINPPAEAVERYMDALEAYWAGAHSHRRRGGRTMYRS